MFLFRADARHCVPLLLAALLFAAPAALARPEMAGQAAASRFSAMDADKDGKVSRGEFFAAQPNMKDAAFASIDTDRDGFISAAEWDAFIKGHGKGDEHATSSHAPGHTEDAAGASPGSGEKPSGKKDGKAPDLIAPPAKR